MSQKLIKLVFVEDGYVMKIRGSRKGFNLALGPRFLMEMEGWLKETLEVLVAACSV